MCLLLGLLPHPMCNSTLGTVRSPQPRSLTGEGSPPTTPALFLLLFLIPVFHPQYAQVSRNVAFMTWSLHSNGTGKTLIKKYTNKCEIHAVISFIVQGFHTGSRAIGQTASREAKDLFFDEVTPVSYVRCGQLPEKPLLLSHVAALHTLS